MENANPTIDDCLRVHIGRLIHALDAQEAPRTYGDILKAARALIAVKKAIDMICKTVKGVDIDVTLPPMDAPGMAADAPPPALNRQMRRMLDAKTRKRS